jgi:hypothetical protein
MGAKSGDLFAKNGFETILSRVDVANAYPPVV